MLDDIGTSDQYANVASNDRWVITVYDTGIYSIQTTNNLGGYLTTGGSTANEHQLSTAATASTNTRWTFRKYTGEAIEGYGWHSGYSKLMDGETATYSAYMYSSVIRRNGNITYSVKDEYGDPISGTTINATTGVVTVGVAQDIRVCMHPYENAAWYGYKSVEVILESKIIHTIKHSTQEKLIFPSQTTENSYLTASIYQSSTPQMMWVFEDAGSGYYTIKNDITGYFLKAPEDNLTNSRFTVAHPGQDDTDYFLFYITRASDGYFLIQSKNQKNRTTSTPLYVALSGSNIVQSSNLNIATWDLKPLTLQLNILYDQALVDRYPSSYRQILNNIYFTNNSNNRSLKLTYKQRFGIKLKIVISSSTFVSYPEAHNCSLTGAEHIDNYCLGYNCDVYDDSVSEPTSTNEAELIAKHYQDCSNGLHHKYEWAFLDNIPDTSNSPIKNQCNVLHTGYHACNYGYDSDNQPFHHSTLYGGAYLPGTSAVIFNHHFLFTTESTETDYDTLIKVVAHEICHNFGVDHCLSAECIMTKKTNGNESYQNHVVCTQCMNAFKTQKFRLYES